MSMVELFLITLVKLNKLESSAAGQKSACLAHSIDYIQRLIRNHSKHVENDTIDNKKLIEQYLNSYHDLIELNISNNKKSHMIHSSIDFLKRHITIEVEKNYVK